MEIIYNRLYWANPDDMVASELFIAGDGDYSSNSALDLARCLVEKYDECSQGFIADLVTGGIVNPLWCYSRQEITILDGHHRLAVAYVHNLEVPLFIDTSVNGSKYYSQLRKESRLLSTQ